jgi:hypothetical protein
MSAFPHAADDYPAVHRGKNVHGPAEGAIEVPGECVQRFAGKTQYATGGAQVTVSMRLRSQGYGLTERHIRLAPGDSRLRPNQESTISSTSENRAKCPRIQRAIMSRVVRRIKGGEPPGERQPEIVFEFSP